MSSDPPPPITPNINSNPRATPTNQQRSTIPLVTQQSQLTQEFDPVLNTPARAKFQNQQHIFTHDWLIDHAKANPSPQG